MESTIISVIAVALLLAANAFFVAAEFALVKARGYRIEALAAENSAPAQMILRIRNNMEAYLAACQLGITMASLGLGWVGEPAVAAVLEPLFRNLGMGEHMLHTVSFLLGFLLFSSLHIVLGEQVPKTFAIRRAEASLLLLVYPLHLSYLMTLPLNWLLNTASRRLLSLFGVEEATHADVMSGDEIKGMVATSKEHGEIEEEKATMLKNLFEFDQRVVSRIMIPYGQLTVLDINGDPQENLRRIRESGHSRFPVIDSTNDNALKGVVIAKDIHNAVLDGQEQPWQQIGDFIREPLVVPERQRVPLLFENMRVMRAHMAMVIDEYGAFIGIVTLEDLIEEIVGEIHDETDVESPDDHVYTTDENHWELDGLLSLSDLERLIGLEVADDPDVNTLSGLFIFRLERMPEAGDVVEEGGFRLTVLAVEDCHVDRVLIERLPGSSGEDSGVDPDSDVENQQ
ncbi:MAG: hemolysin family protein [Leptospirillia bacterium]